MKLPDFLTEAPFGEIRLTGHRIGLYHLIHDHQQGYSPERLLEEFPTLSLESINKVLAFYRANQEEVDACVARCRQESERERWAGKTFDVEELIRRRQARERQKTED